MNTPANRFREGAALVALLALFVLVAGWRLGEPNVPVFDEVYHVRTAIEYLRGQEIYEWTHPPLAKLLMAAAIGLAHGEFDLTTATINWNAATWRVASLLAATGALAGAYTLARGLTASSRLALAATALLAVDGCFFVHARTGMLQAFWLCFALWALVGAWGVLSRERGWWLAGLGFGLAFATRWSTLAPWAITLGLIGWQVWTVKRHAWNALPDADATTEEAQLESLWRNADRPAVAGYALRLVGWFFVVPGLIYLMSYLPNVLQGPGPWWAHLFAWNHGGHGWGWVLALQPRMLSYHAGGLGQHAYFSPWWSWPLMLRPVWYHFAVLGQGHAIGVWAIGNGLVWWAALPALGWAAWRGGRHGEAALGFVACYGLGQWLFWAIQPRQELYMQYFLESIPFACIAIAVAASRLAGRGAGWRVAVLGYGVLALGWFGWYYPLMSGWTVAYAFIEQHLIFGHSWL